MGVVPWTSQGRSRVWDFRRLVSRVRLVCSVPMNGGKMNVSITKGAPSCLEFRGWSSRACYGVHEFNGSFALSVREYSIFCESRPVEKLV